MSSTRSSVVAITGGASGIGFSCAQRFSAEGYAVSIADISEQRLEASLASIRASGGEAIAHHVDVRNLEQQQNFVNKTYATYGQVDCVIAAAGISKIEGSSDKEENERGETNLRSHDLIFSSFEEWNTVININLNGLMLTNKLFAVAMVNSGKTGNIINIASIAARYPFAGSTAYCASKAGVVMLTKVLSRELADVGIRVNAIAPGFIETPLTQRLQTEVSGRQMVEAMTPLKRLGKPEEIAATAYFLACEDASFFTGEVLFPTGGVFVG